MDVRRLPLIAVLGLAGLAGLAACRADPAVAAYVGDVRITEAEVDQVVDDLRAEVGGSIEQELADLAEELDQAALAEQEAQRFGELERQLAAVRTQVVEMRVITVAATGYAQREQLAVPDPDRAQVGTDLGLPADSSYVAVVAEFVAVRDALRDSVEPVPPTEADQREVYENLVAEGLTASFAQVRPELDEQLLGRPVALRNLLTELVTQADIQLNPRYDLVYRVPVQIGNAQTWLGVPLGGDSVVVDSDSAVVDSG
jgi:parvulin-like peptidyl-prolyl isomerase